MMDKEEEPPFWNNIPVIYVRGTHYEIGKSIGDTFQYQIQTYLTTSNALNKEYMPFTCTQEGKALVDKYESRCNTIFPQYMDEIRGIAEGAQVNFRKLLILHLGNDISLILRKKGTGQLNVEGCTTILSKSKESILFSHNEDVPPECVTSGYLIAADIVDPSRTSQEKWISFANPGVIPGNTFGFNSHGLVYSMNDVVHEYSDVADCTPRRFIMRSLLPSKSIEDAERIFKEHGPVGAGFTINYAQPCAVNRTHRLASLEFFRSSVNIRDIGEDETYCHTNLYVERKEAQYPHPTSTLRRERFFAISKERRLCTRTAILEFMSDTENTEYPVFRDGALPDDLATTATALFDLTMRKMSVYRGPASLKKPVFQISLDFLS